MNSYFIKSVLIKKVRHLSDIEIQISDSEKKHLILTGKNGSGKTSVLHEIRQNLLRLDSPYFHSIRANLSTIRNLETAISSWEKELLNTNEQNKQNLLNSISVSQANLESSKKQLDLTEPVLSLSFNSYLELSQEYHEGNFIFAFFDAKRSAELNAPTGITKFTLNPRYSIVDKVGYNFIQYIVNLRADKSFARDDGDFKSVEAIDSWFNSFEHSLKDIFSDASLELVFNRKTYNFDLITEGHEKTDLNHLSDGYSAIISIVTELILRMESKGLKAYDLQGVVLIDELETHLHIELQKKILPFLTSFFPNIQFIITTHSPFVVSSIKNAIVFDLEKKYKVEDMTGYSVDAIIENYFDSDKYSRVLKNKVERFEYLSSVENISRTEQEELDILRKYFKTVSKINSPELILKLQQIDFANLKGRND